MGQFHRLLGRVSIVWSLIAVLGMPPAGRADAFNDYVFAGSFELPPGADRFDALPDGRIVSLVGQDVYIETGPGSRAFAFHGTLPDADMASYGAAFVCVSPDGTKLAVGNNGGASGTDYEVGVFALGDLAGTWFSANHWQGAWYDSTHIALTAGQLGSPSLVTLLDMTSGDPLDPTNPVVVDNIGGASAGVAFDEAGNLYTGNGFALGGPSGTGAIKAFDAASWETAWAGGQPLDFEAQGTLIVDVLSADSLGFDAEGNLHVGGGDGDTHVDFAALVHHAAIDDALLGMGPADPEDPTQVRRLDPDSDNPFDFYSVEYNAARKELYLNDYADTTVYVYAVSDVPVPTVSAWGVVVMTLLIVTIGTVVLHRRVMNPRGQESVRLSRGAVT